MNQELINEVTSHKHLGLFFSDDWSWHEHFDYMKSKAWFRINIMRKLKFKLDKKSLQIIYSFFIRPLLEYADVVWDNCMQNENKELEKIQNEAARIVTGFTKLVSIHSLLQETGWETLASRRKKHKFILFFKMQNGLSPDYLSSLLAPTVGSTTYEMIMISIQFMLILRYIIIHSFLRRFADGMSYPKKHVTCLLWHPLNENLILI